MNILSNFYNNRYRNKKWEKNKGVCTPFYSLNLFRQSLASAVSNLSSEKNSDSLIPNASQIYNMLYGEEKISYQKEAEKRINDYISKYCMLCGIKLEKNVIGSQKKNYFK